MAFKEANVGGEKLQGVIQLFISLTEAYTLEMKWEGKYQSGERR